MIAASRVTVRIEGRALVDDVSLAAHAGEILAIVGSNGAGKSTLMACLSGDRAPSSGRVEIDGRATSDWTKTELAQRRAVLPQQSDLSFPFTAGEVVLLGRTPWAETLHDRTIARMAMALTDTLHLEERSYPTLSGGERQRVHAARAVAQIWESRGERALLLDEPTSSLDPAHQHGMMKLARRMAEDGCAVVCVLHDLNLAAQYATRIGVMAGGRLICCDEPARALEPTRIRDAFGLDVQVMPHPVFPCPLVISLGAVT